VRQRPPAYSAIRIDGVRAYERARRGEAFAVPERTVTVYRFDQLWREDDVRGGYEIECSSGTYVRSLVAELGDAYCESLRRTEIGPWSADAADGETLIPLGEVLSAFLPVVELEGEQARRARHGAVVDLEPEGSVVLADADGPICIAEPREGGGAKASVGFRA
jgi:tRNA pseudouridine55 synthase